MHASYQEKANSFDRILRQKTTNYLKDCEKNSLRLMELAYESNSEQDQKRIDKLRNGITQIRNDIEYGSFAALPSLRASSKFRNETPNIIEQEISRLLSVSELLLLHSRELFDSIQSIQRIFYDSNQDSIVKAISSAEEALRNIEELQRSRMAFDSDSVNRILAGYTETVSDLNEVAKKEELLALEAKHFEGLEMDKTPIFQRIVSKVARKPMFENEIRDTILAVSEKLKTQSGGLIRLAELFYTVKASNPTKGITLKDVESVVENLEEQGLIPGIREISGLKIVELSPVTATPDQNVILDLASKNNGTLEIEPLIQNTRWTFERANRGLKEMEIIGIAKYDLTNHYWIFPVFANKTVNEE